MYLTMINISNITNVYYTYVYCDKIFCFLCLIVDIYEIFLQFKINMCNDNYST